MWGDLTPVCRFQVWHWQVVVWSVELDVESEIFDVMDLVDLTKKLFNLRVEMPSESVSESDGQEDDDQDGGSLVVARALLNGVTGLPQVQLAPQKLF